jgi:hypothetical protein
MKYSQALHCTGTYIHEICFSQLKFDAKPWPSMSDTLPHSHSFQSLHQLDHSVANRECLSIHSNDHTKSRKWQHYRTTHKIVKRNHVGFCSALLFLHQSDRLSTCHCIQWLFLKGWRRNWRIHCAVSQSVVFLNGVSIPNSWLWIFVISVFRSLHFSDVRTQYGLLDEEFNPTQSDDYELIWMHFHLLMPSQFVQKSSIDDTTLQNIRDNSSQLSQKRFVQRRENKPFSRAGKTDWLQIATTGRFQPHSLTEESCAQGLFTVQRLTVRMWICQPIESFKHLFKICLHYLW